MRASLDPLGNVLVRTGALTDESLADILDQQRHSLSLGSLCYVLGYLDEEKLARALSRQFGLPAVILDRSIVRLDVLDQVPRETLIHYRILPVYEDARRIFIAAENPIQLPDFVHELAFMRGKIPVVHAALEVTLARSTRDCYRALERGERYCPGPHAVAPAVAGDSGTMVVVSDLDPDSGQTVGAAPVHQALVEDATRELEQIELMEDEITGVELGMASRVRLGTVPMLDTPGHTVPHERFTTEVTDVRSVTEPDSLIIAQAIGLGDNADVEYHREPTEPRAGHILIIDGDLATRHRLVKTLGPLGLTFSATSDGAEAIRHLETHPPDVVILDVTMPEIDSVRLCQTIKQSRRYKHIAVILISALIDPGQVTDDVLDRYEAEAYYEKPLDVDSLKLRVQDILRVGNAATPVVDDGSFGRAMEYYRSGDLDHAIEVLRAGLEIDPLSAKHHFVLANLLQKKSQIYEAIDEYEATIDLKPDYFPALTRLAYLYYKKGFAAKAIEMWRRALPHCADTSLRNNIETFMRKLIAEMRSEL